MIKENPWSNGPMREKGERASNSKPAQVFELGF